MGYEDVVVVVVEVAVVVVVVAAAAAVVQCSLDLSFLRGPAKINDECGKMINPKHHFF
jgi:hypothetical protein